MRRRQFISLVGGTALASLTSLPVFADSPEACGVPIAQADGWSVASANEDKLVDRGALCRMADPLAASGNTNIHAVLVTRSGKLVFERYFRGSDEIPGLFSGRRVKDVTFDADTLHDVKSISKSVASSYCWDRAGSRLDTQRQRTDLQLFSRVERAFAYP